MRMANRAIRRYMRVLILAGVALAFTGCGTGSVYVGVAAPGPWVGYPPGVYPRYPGYYGRPWYSPDEEEPQRVAPRLEEKAPEAPEKIGVP